MGKRIKVAAVVFSVLLGFLVSPDYVSATEFACDNRFVNLVNPVRGRSLWGINTLKPIQDQYGLISKEHLPATWLLQYDVLKDGNLSGYIKGFDESQEKGLLLEISQALASDSEVIYPQNTPWASPSSLFLSGYKRAQRIKLIDTSFNEFRKTFGIYPKSVGAWWVDSYSIGYMVKKYKIGGVMIVADQKTTDKYGVWGQWWGIPYYPSKANILAPAGDNKNKSGVLVIQWAQRDLTNAYGEGPNYSNYSLQANDYKDRGLTTLYFSDLVDTYLNCENRIGQVTIGLETGMESIANEEEYKNQLEALLKKRNLKFATISEFARKFSEIQPQNGQYKLKDSHSTWILDTKIRRNDFLGDLIVYDSEVSFPDYFIPDKSDVLTRWLPLSNKNKPSLRPYELLIFVLISFFLLRTLGLRVVFASILLAVSSYGLIFRSDYKKGWAVFYSAPFDNILLIQVALFLASFLIVYFFGKVAKTKKGIFFLPMIFGLDCLVRAIRISKISGDYLVGLAKSETGFIGIKFGGESVRFVNENFDSAVSASLLKVNFDKLLTNPSFSLFYYPLAHITAAFLALFLLRKVSLKYKIILIVMLFILFLANIFIIFNSDPLSVKPLI